MHQGGGEGQDNAIITNGNQEGVINLAVATTQEDHNSTVAIVVPEEGEVHHFVARVVAGTRSGGGHTNSNNYKPMLTHLMIYVHIDITIYLMITLNISFTCRKFTQGGSWN